MKNEKTPTAPLAYLIGISDYTHMSPLTTPLADVRALGELLRRQYAFEVEYLENPDRETLEKTFRETLPDLLSRRPDDSQLLLYFAGHGFAQDSEKGFSGYLIPRDGRPGEVASWYPMANMQEALATIPSRHLLLILDCCFGGAFRFAGRYRGVRMASGKRLFRQHYHHFRSNVSRQVISSTAPNQQALDFLDHSAGQAHSPFAHCLMQGLQGMADQLPDKVLTCAELYSYLQQQMPVITADSGHPQHVGLFPLDQHQNGEFLFLLPDFREDALKEQDYLNPYQGLEAYQPDDAGLFFGRAEATARLQDLVSRYPLVVVSGASGTGKSSLVMAGVVPRLKEAGKSVQIISPGRDPLAALPDPQGYEVLIIDQFEQLITQAPAEESAPFFARLQELLHRGKQLILTLRIDFEAQLPVPESLKPAWAAGRFLAPPFTAEELREIIITPALRVGRFIEPPSLVDTIIDEVIHYPGSLPLLSFTLQQLFERCRENPYRNITEKDYEELGGVTGALQSSANRILQGLSPAEQATLRHLMLRMVSLSGGETAGRRVLRPELDFPGHGENERVARILKLLEAERLIRAGTDIDGQEYLEPAHDALVRSWKTVQEWIKNFGAENILLQQRSSAAAGEYQLHDQRKGYLWHDNPNLDRVLLLRRRSDSPLVLNTLETHFIEKSRRRRRRNSLSLWGSVLLVIAGLSLLSFFAVRQQQIAQSQQKLAETRQQEAEQNLLKFRKAERERNNQLLGPLMSEAEVFIKADEWEMARARYAAVDSVLLAIDSLTEDIDPHTDFHLSIDTLEFTRKKTDLLLSKNRR